jgi:hypothetical protein
MYIKKKQFLTACEQNDTETVKRYLTQDYIDISHIKWGFSSGCVYNCYETLECLLPFIDTIPHYDLTALCRRPFSNIERLLKIIKMLLNSGKVNDIENIVRPSASPLSGQEAAVTVKRINDLLDEYMFRLDGPIYNENIID